MKTVSIFSLCSTAIFLAQGSLANQVGTITQLDGQVKLFTNPGKAMSGPAPHASFEGEYYSVQDAQVGMKVDRANVLRTAPGAKARIVFENGDQFNIGPATAYRVTWQDQGAPKPEVNLMYGKIRAVISKDGQRSGLQIKTRTATMGVRGTDLYVADRVTKGTEVSVIRGEVSVKTAASAKSVPVKAGATAEVPAAPQVDRTSASVSAAAPKPAEVQVRATTQQDLAVIQRSSDIKKEIAKGDLNSKSEAEVKKLEAQAVQTTLQDIKKYDPKMYEKISKEAASGSAVDLNKSVVASASKAAPKGADKAGEDELERLDDDAYNKYFKIVD